MLGDPRVIWQLTTATGLKTPKQQGSHPSIVCHTLLVPTLLWASSAEHLSVFMPHYSAQSFKSFSLSLKRGERERPEVGHGLYHPQLDSALHGTASCWESMRGLCFWGMWWKKRLRKKWASQSTFSQQTTLASWSLTYGGTSIPFHSCRSRHDLCGHRRVKSSNALLLADFFRVTLSSS